MLTTAQEMVKKQRDECASQAMRILEGNFEPELAKAAKSPSLRRIDVYIDEKDQMVIGEIVRSLRDAGYRVEVEIRRDPKRPEIKKPCFTLGW